MSVIAFMLDFETGHVFPSFGLARSLISRGHNVYYLGIADIEGQVRDQGFDFYPIFCEIYPPGYVSEHLKKHAGRTQNDIRQQRHLRQQMQKHIPQLLVPNDLDDAFRELQPDLLVTSYFIILEALIIHYKHDIPQVLFNPIFSAGDATPADLVKQSMISLPPKTGYDILAFVQNRGCRIKSAADFTAPLEYMSVLISFPEELTLPGYKPAKNVHFIESSFREEGQDMEQLNILRGKVVLFAGLGSMGVLFKEKSMVFYRKIIEVMKKEEFEDFHLIVSLGNYFKPGDFDNVPDNVTLLNWAPQMEILKRASLALTHGGLGTIKECLYYGVPMIVMPLGRDQPDNAKMVEARQLGIMTEIETVSVEDLAVLITGVLANTAIRESVQRIKKITRDKEKSQIGAMLIEKIVDSCHSPSIDPV